MTEDEDSDMIKITEDEDTIRLDIPARFLEVHRLEAAL